ncbi:hypothetical protein JTE90_001996 [Oedothorax gibbosus]|uniref:Peptidase M14 domain-containing protein n=1 Tax=Oedothorax gibbosus TaxID=931172 RepID=A0AAV6U9A1_9ARAC|nr:hypothetical protein JTE90_001996 [Oedothorax gibbosus]
MLAVVGAVVVFAQLIDTHQFVGPGDDRRQHYSGYSVFRMVPTDEEELSVLKSMANRDEYQETRLDVMCPGKGGFVSTCSIAHRIPRAIVMYDIERYIAKERLEMEMPSFLSFRGSDPFFSGYKQLEEIYKFVDQLAERHPNITSVFSIGESAEGRQLKVIKIGSKSTSVVAKPAIWIDGGIHAREWISPATVAYIAHSLASEYDASDDTRQLVDHFDWYVLPVLNPDGYVYSHSVNRMWRKSRKGPLIFCRGVDLNRNFGFHWREGGSSARPCSDIYAGFQPFSEPESKAVSDFILQRKEVFSAYLAVHSYSQLWLTPWGWTSALPPHYDDMIKVAKEAVKALSEVHGTKYRVGSSTNLLYVATGGADDWAHGVAGIKYSYTLELRDTGKHGFLLPAEQILPTGEETWAGVKAMAKAIKRDT